MNWKKTHTSGPAGLCSAFALQCKGGAMLPASVNNTPSDTFTSFHYGCRKREEQFLSTSQARTLVFGKEGPLRKDR